MTLDKQLDATLELLRSHTSIRDYKKEDIPPETLKRMLVSAQHAATSHFVQAYSVIHITDPEKKEAIATLSNNRRQIESAPVLLLFCADMKRLEYACKKQGTNIQNEILENFLVGVIDTALFAQNFVVAAESQKYGICYIGGVRNNPEEISNVVGLPDKTFPLFGMTVGVPDETQLVKPRLPVNAILHENVYNEEKYDELLDQYDSQLEDYYGHRFTNQKNTNWTITMSDFLSVPRREHMRPFVNSKGFHLK
ncbi:NADPH-dependent oxidoreductase [Peribacillus cavernae]|uniref:NADPH-dependent oxidoreductase n=1 Tax=Peribacillus cavernae TaxID=1674310 RepID=A0A3S0VIE1_9BACI|nr:NADPH-dependent oxidoreductase [Peribacillus cavernae]MDQ0219149.1 nitroreductase [Peribacillus cavernae]RUQ28622.1 NADPH-dependent oxidoreductase [Peribacillus cavernae]